MALHPGHAQHHPMSERYAIYCELLELLNALVAAFEPEESPYVIIGLMHYLQAGIEAERPPMQ